MAIPGTRENSPAFAVMTVRPRLRAWVASGRWPESSRVPHADTLHRQLTPTACALRLLLKCYATSLGLETSRMKPERGIWRHVVG